MTDLEDRLRDAFAARADLVTPQSLRPRPAPPPPPRRLPRWVVPGITGLAVAATAAGVLVATAPARDAAQPGPPAPASPSPSPSVSPTVPPVPALARTLLGSGWTVRVPATWRTHPNDSGTARAGVTCVGPDEQPCQLRLAAGIGPAAVPDPGVLGGNLLTGLDASSCRRVGGITGARVGGGAAGTEAAALTRWACGQESYEQVTLPARMLLVVARTSDGPTVSAVLQTLGRDPSYVRGQ